MAATKTPFVYWKDRAITGDDIIPDGELHPAHARRGMAKGGVMLRLTQDEYNALYTAAEAAGVPATAFARRGFLSAAKTQGVLPV